MFLPGLDSSQMPLQIELNIRPDPVQCSPHHRPPDAAGAGPSSETSGQILFSPLGVGGLGKRWLPRLR
jgi:hypothetical protein